MRRLSLPIYAPICALALAASTSANAGPLSDPIGSTLAVVNVVTAQYETEKRNLVLGDSVRQNEVVEVALDAKSEFQFKDDTKLALGPGARMTLDKFVYDANAKSGSISVNMIKGAFRWVTGVASKSSYSIKLPAASITVRGTVFDVFVEDTGATWVLLHEGGIKACNLRGTCRVLDEPGKLLLINDAGDIGVPFRWASLNGQQKTKFDTAYPFVGGGTTIDGGKALSRDAIMAKPVRKAEKPKSEKIKTASASQSATDETPVATVKPLKSRKPKVVINEDKPAKVVVTPVKLPKTPKVVRNGDDDDKPILTTKKKRKWMDVADDYIRRYRDKVATSDDVSNDGPVGTGPSIGPSFPRHPRPPMGDGKPPAGGGDKGPSLQ